MDPMTMEQDAKAALESQMDGDYYYTKALNYLAASSLDNAPSDKNANTCPTCNSPEDKDFTLCYRRGSTRDNEDVPSSGSSNSINSSPRGNDDRGTASPSSVAVSCSSSSSSSSPHPPDSPKRNRERKYSIGGRFYKTGSGQGEFGKIEPKRKLSDGHVHWADEFQKELTRFHPRKSYSRHPSHLSSQVKPILKFCQEHDSEQCS